MDVVAELEDLFSVDVAEAVMGKVIELFAEHAYLSVTDVEQHHRLASASTEDHRPDGRDAVLGESVRYIEETFDLRLDRQPISRRIDAHVFLLGALGFPKYRTKSG